MKKTIILSLLLSLLLPSCSSVLEDLDTAVTSAETQVIELVVPPVLFDGEGVTRTNITPTDKGLSFGWAVNDVVGVYASQSKANFNITQISQDSKYATFDGGGFGLVKGSTYYAFYPYQESMDKQAIPVSYSGQTQTANGSTSHLSQYDYMTSRANAVADNTAVFAFSHLGSIIRFNITAPANEKYTAVSIKAPQKVFALSGMVDLTASTPSVVASASSLSDVITLKLGNDGLNSSGNSLLAYLCVAPVNLEGKTLTITLYTANNHTDISVAGKNFTAGKAFNFDCAFGNAGNDDKDVIKRNSTLELTNWYVIPYLNNVTYDPADYSYTKVNDYYNVETMLDIRADWPQGKRIGGVDRFNLIPGRTYTYEYYEGGKKVIETLKTTGFLRQLTVYGVENVRDLGGWNTEDGHKIKYGKLYRGSELNNTHGNKDNLYKTPHEVTPEGITIMRDVMGVKAELDIRNLYERPEKYRYKSVLGDDIYYKGVDLQWKDIQTDRTRTDLREMLKFVITNLQQGRPVYYHCVVGADRTGLFSHMILGLLGVRRRSIDKDYELTTFAGQPRDRTEPNYAKARAEVDKCYGNTQQEKYYNWWLNTGMTSQELDSFLDMMLE